MQALRKLAMRYPETEEGVSCKGTSLERVTVKAKNKAFLFLGTADLRLKLRESLADASKLASKQPSCLKVGAQGWVWAKFSEGAFPLDLLVRWIDESYRVVVNWKPTRTTIVKKATKAKRAASRHQTRTRAGGAR